jgi:protocatechuate 3,4-dioxygenase beta subunit
MHPRSETHGRRRFLHGLVVGSAAWTTRGVFAQQLAQTATTTEGPFYPDKFPLDTDNDLLLINDGITPGVGEITHLTGRLLTATGQPVRNAFIEIWQVDQTGSYVHTGGRQPTGNDRHFQGYGRYLTDARGQYYFRTIKPIDYTLINIFRTAHIHVAVSMNGRRMFTTQLFVAGHPANARDSLVRGMNPTALRTLMVDFAPLAGSKLGELTANFDIVLGRTPQEMDIDGVKTIAAPLSRRPGV